jgi:hypothetical protein
MAKVQVSRKQGRPNQGLHLTGGASRVYNIHGSPPRRQVSHVVRGERT